MAAKRGQPSSPVPQPVAVAKKAKLSSLSAQPAAPIEKKSDEADKGKPSYQVTQPVITDNIIQRPVSQPNTMETTLSLLTTQTAALIEKYVNTGEKGKSSGPITQPAAATNNVKSSSLVSQAATAKKGETTSSSVTEDAKETRRRYWSRDEDRILLQVYNNTVKKKNNRVNWDEIAKKVHGKTRRQCSKRYSVISSRSKTTNVKWTPEEDEALVKAFENTKKRASGHPNWVAIADKLEGRNRNQCFTRYSFISNRSSTRNIRWLATEDNVLLKAYSATVKFSDGRTDWATIADKLPGRNRRQCCERYGVICSRSKTTNIRWTPEEDQKLLKAFEDTAKHADGSPDWVTIAEKLDGRNRKQCSKRYSVKCSTSKTRNMRWSAEEDNTLMKAYANTPKLEDGRPNWESVARKVPGRNRIQCLSRYQYKLHHRPGTVPKTTPVNDKGVPLIKPPEVQIPQPAPKPSLVAI